MRHVIRIFYFRLILFFYIGPPSIIQSQTSNTVFVREGMNVNLTCMAEGYPHPNISWVRVSGDRMNNGLLRHDVSRDLVLTIHIPSP